MQVRVTNAAVENLHGHIVGAQVAALEGEGRERCTGRLGSVADGVHEAPLYKSCVG
ncbi:hypothetical protein D3C78_1939670 [compost metagenome]